MWLLTRWEFELVEGRSVSISGGWNAITHQLRVQIDRNDVSVNLSVDGMPLHTQL